MFILRNVLKKDLNYLFSLSHLNTFINLPNDLSKISELIEKSTKSFTTPSKNLFENYYYFVLEDSLTSEIVGVSCIHAQHGTISEPHFFLKINESSKILREENKVYNYKTLKLGYEVDGPTEIGGLVLNPKFRKSREKFGKQISFIRFLYIALFPERFKEEIHAELLPPFDINGKSVLWENLGRKFLHLNYHDADILSRKNKHFILDLFPQEEIYETLLPKEAQEVIGKVGESTEPVKNMLSKIGFEFIDEVDPFDGGPHYRALQKNILPIQKKITGLIKENTDDSLLNEEDNYLLQIPIVKDQDLQFMAIKTPLRFENGEIYLPKHIIQKFPNIINKETMAIPF